MSKATEKINHGKGSAWEVSDYSLALILFILLNVLVFHNGLYGHLCIVDSYAGDLYGRLAVLRKLENQHGKKVIALIGDSTTEEGIGARELSENTGEPVANLALPGTGPVEWVHFLRSIDPERNRFRTLIITIAPHNRRSKPHEEGFQTLLAVAPVTEMLAYASLESKPWERFDYFYGAFDRIYAFRRDLRDLFLSPSRVLTVARQKREQLAKLENWPGQTFDVCRVRLDPKMRKVLDWGGIRDRQMRGFAENAIERTVKLNRNPVVSGLQPLEQVLDDYNYSTTKIVIVTIPFSLHHKIRPNAPPIQAYYAQMESFAAHPNVFHWNAVAEPVFQDCKNFFDFRHLNATGRERFSKRLADQLEQLNSGQVPW